MRRLISLVFKICLGVTLVYYVGVNGFLMTPYAGKLMMMAPDIVQLRYSRAYSLVPFHIVAEDLRISVQDPAVQVYISADVASGDIYPWTLLNNTFYATNLKGEGLVFRLRERLDDEKIKPETAALMPPIPGYDSIALSPVPPPAKPLRVRLGSLHVTNLSEVWINEMKFDGRIDVDGSFEFEAFKFVEVPGVELNNVALQLTRAGKPMVKISSLVLKASLDEVSLVKVDTEKMLNGITASIAMQAQTQNIGFINSMIHDPDLLLQEGSGKVTLDLSLRDGAFQDGSTVAFDTSRVVMQLPFFELAGRAAIRGEVKKGTTFFNVRVPELVGIQRKDSKKAFTATNLDIEGSTAAQLLKISYANLDLALERGQLHDLRVLNSFIPEGTGMHITSGGGVLTGKFSLSTRTHHGKGAFDLEGNQMALKNRSATVTGHATVHGQINDVNIDTGAMDISGSTIGLNDIGVWADGAVYRDVWVKLAADPCTAAPKGAVKWATKMSMTFSNLQPVLAMVAANAPVPGALKSFADVPNVRFATELTVHEKDIEIRKLRVDSSKLQIDGDLRLSESGESAAQAGKLYPWGALLVKVRALTAGVDLQGTVVRPILGDPDGWYTKYRAEHPTPATKTAAAL